jgi:hypothetical protein
MGMRRRILQTLQEKSSACPEKAGRSWPDFESEHHKAAFSYNGGWAMGLSCNDQMEGYFVPR